MELPNELTRTKAASVGFTWAITWRFLLVSFGLGWLVEQLPLPAVFDTLGTWPALAVSLVASFIIYWMVALWVLRSGFGSVKIVLLEQAHYQELASKLSSEE